MTGKEVMNLAVIAAMLVAGCAKTPVTGLTSAPAPGTARTGAAASRASVVPASDGSSTGRSSSPTTSSRPAPSEFVAVRELEDVHFDLDAYTIRPGDADVLDRGARWLRANADRTLLIEGHCDERGTSEYNLALGERRAKAAMTYLVDQGIAAGRMTLISYGKERPQCTAHGEACWAKNRRAHFLVKRG